MSELPKEWTRISIDEITSDVSYGVTATSDPEIGDLKLLRITDIQDNKVNWATVPYCKYDIKFENARLCDDDIVVARTGATVGKSFLIKKAVDNSVFASYLIRLRCNDAVQPKYLSRFLNTPSYWRQISEQKAGIGQPNVNGTKLKTLNVPLAPQAEQTRIVEKLDEVLAQVDTIKARLDGIPAILKRFRQSVLAAAVSGRLTAEWRGNSPSKWKEITLSECTTRIGDGLHGTPIYSKDGGFYFVNGNNLSDGKIIIKENTRQVDLIEFDKHRRELNEHTLLLSINGTIGNLALYNGEPIILGKSACYINFNEMIMREFGYILLSSLGFLQYAKQVATGATIQNVPLKGIRNYKFNLPSLEEQKIIIGLVNQYINFANTIEAQVKKTQERVDNLTQSILAKAFRGELVAQDPNDEPAEKLLERIAQARREAEALAKAAKKVAKTK